MGVLHAWAGTSRRTPGGPRALKYGVTRDYVIGLEWVLPDGEVIRVGRRTIKGVAGYDLVGLFVGLRGHARGGHGDHAPAHPLAARM